MDKEVNLSELYSFLATSKKLETKGVKVPENILAQLSSLEEQLIREKVLPVLRDKIEPVLRQIRRELTLVVEYSPDASISVRLSRERNLIDLDATTLLTPDPVPDIKRRKSQQREGVRGPNTKLRVTTPEGQVFCDAHTATNTFCDILEHIGLLRVRQLGKISSSFNLVSTSKDPNRQQRQFGNLYVFTHSSTADKAKLLRRISDKLGLGLTIEII